MTPDELMQAYHEAIASARESVAAYEAALRPGTPWEEVTRRQAAAMLAQVEMHNALANALSYNPDEPTTDPVPDRGEAQP